MISGELNKPSLRICSRAENTRPWQSASPFSTPAGSAFSGWYELAPLHLFKPSDSRTESTSAPLVSDGPQSPQEKKTGWLRHQVLSDALIGMRHRVETAASVWTVGLTSTVPAEFVTRNWVLASPWTLSFGQPGHISRVWVSTSLELPGTAVWGGKVSPKAMFGCLWTFPQG